MDTGLYADRSDRAKLRFTGEQRAWFLDQILTQSFEDMSAGEARDTALLTVHGRMQAYMEFLALDDRFLCHFEPSLRATLPDELRRYVFATRVEIDDVTKEFGLVLVAHDDVNGVLGAAGATGHVHPTTALGVPAAYLWVERESVPSVTEALASAGLHAAAEAELEAIRIRNGVARWGYDMDTKTFPQEAEVDGRAVHYEKGCYLGQEAMAKIHFRGKVNRKLFRMTAGGELVRGDEVTLDGQRIGAVTSSADSVGLALLKHTTEPGAEVMAGSVPATVVD